MAAGDLAIWADIAYVLNPPTVRLIQQVAQSVLSNTATFLTYTVGSEDIDTHGFHSETTNTTRITPTIAGRYACRVSTSFAGAATTTWIRAGVAKNGSVQSPIVQNRPASAALQMAETSFAIVACNGSTDYLEHYAAQLDSGAAARLTNVAGGFQSVFECYRIGSL